MILAISLGAISVEALERAAELLLQFSPRVELEPSLLDPLKPGSFERAKERTREGALFLDTAGLDRLHPDKRALLRSIRDALRSEGFKPALALGFSRARCFAIARCEGGLRILKSEREERARAAGVPIARLGISPNLTRELGLLGVHKLGQLEAIDRGELRARFGQRDERAALDLLLESFPEPLFKAPERYRVIAELEWPDHQLDRLLFYIKGALHSLLADLMGRSLAAASLTLELRGASGSDEESARLELEPAYATRDSVLLLELIRLRLSDLRLEAPVETIELEAQGVRLEGSQLSLFDLGAPSRGKAVDLDAANRGIARLRAAFGDGAAARAILRESYHPSRSFRYEPIKEIRAPGPIESRDLLIRRIKARPEALGEDARGYPLMSPPIVSLAGPYRVEGEGLARDYFYGEREDGAILALFRERGREAWFLEGSLD